MQMKRRELEANLTSIRIEMSANDRFDTVAEHLQENIAKVGFQIKKRPFPIEIPKFVLRNPFLGN